MKHEISDLAQESAVAAVGSKITYGGAATGAFGALTSVNWIGWIGVIVAILGLSINFYFSWKKDQREQAESDLRIKKLMGETDENKN